MLQGLMGISKVTPNYTSNYKGQEKCPECIAHHFTAKYLSNYCARYREEVSRNGHCDSFEE